MLGLRGSVLETSNDISITTYCKDVSVTMVCKAVESRYFRGCVF